MTINGLGERAGNASLEEVVMALRTRPTSSGGRQPRRDRADRRTASRLVSYLTGFLVQPNKAIVGRNAFAHESGIHQDGVLKNPLTYEIMTPQSVGLRARGCRSASSRAGAACRASSRSSATTSRARRSTRVYRAAIALADVKKEVTDADLIALVEQQAADAGDNTTTVAPVSFGKKTIVDLRPWLTAQALAPLAVTAEEKEYARNAMRLADHAVDQAFASALRQSTLQAQKLTPTGKALELAQKVVQLQDFIKQDQAQVNRHHSAIDCPGQRLDADG